MSRLILRLLGIERAERLIGHLLRDAARARLLRDHRQADDLHEARHLYAALKAGDSSECDETCALDRTALADWHTLERARYADPFALRSVSTADVRWPQ